MTQSVVILGGGTGGTLVANRLRRHVPDDDLAIEAGQRIQAALDELASRT